MQFDHAIIDQIVNGVLEQLQTKPSGRAASSIPTTAAAPAKPLVVSAETPAPISMLELSEAVITAELLAKRMQAGKKLRVGLKSLITTAARDWLRAHAVELVRGPMQQSTATNFPVQTVAVAAKIRWHLAITTVTKPVQALMDGYRRQSPFSKIEILGLAQEAADFAVTVLCQADCEGILVLSEHADWIACRANRNPHVRAAVAQDRGHLQKILTQLDANLICLDPVRQTYVELRKIVETCFAKERVAGKSGL